MRVLEIKQGRLRNYGAAQKGDLAYVLTQLIDETGGAMVRKVDTGFEVCAFSVIKDITPFVVVPKEEVVITKEAKKKTTPKAKKSDKKPAKKGKK